MSWTISYEPPVSPPDPIDCHPDCENGNVYYYCKWDGIWHSYFYNNYCDSCAEFKPYSGTAGVCICEHLDWEVD